MRHPGEMGGLDKKIEVIISFHKIFSLLNLSVADGRARGGDMYKINQFNLFESFETRALEVIN